MDLISIIIPVYNGEKTLVSCIESVCNQTHRHWDLYLINDGSFDGTGALCDEFAVKDSRIHVIHQQNSGVSAARNCGLKEASGAYITFLDADDVVPVDYLQTLLQACSNADIAVCDVVTIKGGQEKVRFTGDNGVLTQTEALNCLLTRHKINSGPYAKLFRREVIQGDFFPPLKTYEDILFVCQAFCNADRIAVTNKTEYRYIQNESGAMSSFMKAPSLDIVKATEQLISFIKTRPDLDPKTFYITVSHLMQCVIPLLPNPQNSSRIFIEEVQKLYRTHWQEIVKCNAFPWKEKIVYILFGLGIVYHNKSFVWLKYKNG